MGLPTAQELLATIITVWGYSVGCTWRDNAGLMRPDGTMRPAMAWLMDLLGRGE